MVLISKINSAVLTLTALVNMPICYWGEKARKPLSTYSSVNSGLVGEAWQGWGGAPWGLWEHSKKRH